MVNYIIDTHDAPIIQPVWDLYAKTIAKFGRISTMIERDDNIPPLSDLLEELNQARNNYGKYPNKRVIQHERTLRNRAKSISKLSFKEPSGYTSINCATEKVSVPKGYRSIRMPIAFDYSIHLPIIFLFLAPILVLMPS